MAKAKPAITAVILAVLAGAVVFDGCGIHRTARPPKAPRAPSTEVATAIEEERVIPGMNSAEVQQAWGEPDTLRMVTPEGTEQIWTFVKTRATRVVGSGAPRVVTTKVVWDVHFREDIVTDVLRR